MTGIVLIWAVIFFGPLIAWALFHSRGYKRHPLDHPPAGGGWHPTAECFRDPTTGQPIRVWYDPVSGERAYVRTADEAK